VRSETIAGLEHAVDHLNVPLCVVLGHEGCGAVAATVDQVEARQHDTRSAPTATPIQQLLEQIEPAVRKVQPCATSAARSCSDACEEEHAHSPSPNACAAARAAPLRAGRQVQDGGGALPPAER
jgi:carbonic anhydrase